VQLMKLRINLVMIDPMRKVNKKKERLFKKQENKQKAEEKKRNRK